MDKYSLAILGVTLTGVGLYLAPCGMSLLVRWAKSASA